ncbi:hypothetical protein MJ579_01655 [Klebsiella pneumoniae]|nr:hypothetical protein MJ579_01655 [Klebsiella pneumoniae]
MRKLKTSSVARAMGRVILLSAAWPIDLSVETRLDAEVKGWFAFALQKCGELALLRDTLNSGDTAAITEWSAPIQARRHSTRVHNAEVEKRLAAITAPGQPARQPYEVRAQAQRQRFNLPKWPTTTIGSFRKRPRSAACAGLQRVTLTPVIIGRGCGTY